MALLAIATQLVPLVIAGCLAVAALREKPEGHQARAARAKARTARLEALGRI